MLTISDIRKGKVIVLDAAPYVIVSAEFLRKQQRRPVVRTILKHLQTGATREHSFQQSDRVPEADVGRSRAQFLYRENKSYVFMDQSTFEQYYINPDLIGAIGQFLIAGQPVEIILFEAQPVAVELPIKVDRKVLEAPPGIRGDTSAKVMKDVVIEGGATIKAPLFVSAGDILRIDTRDGTYVERVQG